MSIDEVCRYMLYMSCPEADGTESELEKQTREVTDMEDVPYTWIHRLVAGLFYKAVRGDAACARLIRDMLQEMPSDVGLTDGDRSLLEKAAAAVWPPDALQPDFLFEDDDL